MRLSETGKVLVKEFGNVGKGFGGTMSVSRKSVAGLFGHSY